MRHPDLFVVSILRALVEVALLSLLGEGAVALLSGTRRANNPTYRLFQIVTRPVIGLTRCLTQRAQSARQRNFLSIEPTVSAPASSNAAIEKWGARSASGAIGASQRENSNSCAGVD